MKEMTRTLAAVMFTDMVGYTALMQEDENKAAQQRQRHREVLQGLTRQHKGRLIQYYGDSTLSIFSSAIEAVSCGIGIQKELAQKPIIPLRIGIHTGDIVYNEEGIYGDGVNIASRIESMSVPGAVLISDKVYDDVKSHPSLKTRLLGKFELKNVSRPVEIFALAEEGLSIPLPQEMKGKGQFFAKSIAVLPFVNMSGDPENEYFSDGITEEILNALTKIEGLKITSRTSSFAFKGTNQDIRSIAQQLNVNTILEGSVRKAGNKVRISAQLVNAIDDTHIWSETYDRNLEDIFEVQDEISRIIANKLRVSLSGEQQNKTLVNSPTQNLKAYELYLKGRFHWNKYNPIDAREAITLYDQAIELAPGFVLPYCGKATSYAFLGAIGGLNPHLAFPKGKLAAQKALELDENEHEAYLAIALFELFFEWDWPNAKNNIEKALSLNPGDANVHFIYSMYQLSLGELEMAREEIMKAQALDPLNLMINQLLADIFFYLEDYKKAFAQIERTLAIDPTFRAAIESKGWMLLSQGKIDEAIEVFEEQYKLTGHRLKGFTSLAYAYSRKGEREKTLQFLGMLKDRNKQESEETLHIDFAIIYWGLDEPEKAIDYLEKAIEARMGSITYMKNSPLWKPLQQHPRFIQLMKKMGL